jgi:hypothetical protein
LLRCTSPVVAPLRHARLSGECPFTGIDVKSPRPDRTDVSDPHWKIRALLALYYVRKLLVHDLFLPDGVAVSSQLHRGGISDLSEHAQGGFTTIGTFNYLARNDPTGAVFLAISWEK